MRIRVRQIVAASSFMIHLGPQLSSYHSGQTDRLHDLEVNREGYAQHWIFAVDLTNALPVEAELVSSSESRHLRLVLPGESLNDESLFSSLPDLDDRYTPAALQISALPRFRRGLGHLSTRPQGNGLMTESSVPTPRSLEDAAFALLYSTEARRLQYQFIQRLWLSVGAHDVFALAYAQETSRVWLY